MSKSRNLVGVATGAILALSGAVAHAQEGEGRDDIVITARRTAENLQDVPLAVTALNAETLEEMNVTDVRDLSAAVPGLEIVTAGSERTAVFMSVRGQSAADVILTADPSVGVYVDGVSVPRVFGLSPGMVDLARVEVLKGPQGTLYGRNTTGGAVSFVTRAPDIGEWGGFATAEIGEYNRLDFTGAINIPLGDDAALRLVGRNTTQDGTGQDVSGRDLGDDDNQYYRARFLLEANSAVTIDLTADYTNIESGGQANRIISLNGFPPRPGLPSPANALTEIAIEQGSGFPPNLAALNAAQAAWLQYLNSPGPGGGDFYDAGTDLDGYSVVEMWSAASNISIDLNNFWQLRSITGFRTFERENLFDLDGTPFDILHPQQGSNADFFSQELQLNYSGDRLDAILGAYASGEDGQERGATVSLAAINPNNPNRVLGDVENTSWAIYGQGNFDLTDQLRLTFGARWTEETKELVSRNSAGPAFTCTVPVAIRDNAAICAATLEDTFEDYSYLLSLDYHLNEDVMVYARTARGFRGGGQNLRGSTAFNFSPFEPEVATDYEIGLKADLLDRQLRIGAAFYQTDYADIQRTSFGVVPGTSTVTSLVQNAAAATITGAELEAQWFVSDDLTLSGTLGYIDAGYDEFTDASGDRSSEPFPDPEWTYSLGARYEHPIAIGSYVLRLDYNWRDDQILRPSALIDADVTQEAYGLLNGRAALNFEAWDASIAIFGNNLLEEEYLAGVVDLDSSLGFNVGFQGAPRTIGVEFTKRWGPG